MSKDIELVLKARDRASSELEKISKALKQNVADQQNLAKGAGNTSAALGKLAGDASKFKSELDKLQSAGKVAAELDKATASVTRMEGSLRTNTVELARMARESEAAAQAATRLKGQLAAEESALAANKTALSDSRKELREVNKLVGQAERAQERYNKSLVNTPDTKVRPAARSAGVFIAADLAQQRATQSRVNSEIDQYQSTVKQATDAVKNLRPQVSAAASQQSQLASETQRASAALATEREDINRARNELATVQAVAQQASTFLGGVALSQDAVARASQRASENLVRVQKALQAYSKFDAGSGTVADPKTAANFQRQAAAVEQARQDMKALQAETQRLGLVVRNSSGNVTEQVNAFNRMAAASRQAQAEFQRQITIQNQLRGVTQSSFAAYARATIPLQQAAAATAKVGSSSSQAANSVRAIAPAARQASASFSSLSAALARVANDNGKASSTFDNLKSQVLATAAAYAGFQTAISGIGGALNAYRQLEATQSRLGAVFNQDTGRVAAEIQFLQQQADRLGISFETLGEEYGKFVVAAKTANFTTEDTRKIFLSVAEAARVNKLATEETSGVFLALTQMISKGKVSAEELRGQLGERLTGAFNIFASAIGKTTAELDEMMKKGEVIADRSTLLKFADEMKRRFGPQLSASLDSVSTDIGRFENNVFNAQIAIANGFVPALRLALQSFNTFAQSSEGQEVFRNLGAAAGKLIQILAEIPKYFDYITLAAQAFVAVKVAEVFTGLIGRVVQSTASISAFSRQIQLIGPQTQAAAAAQNIFTRGLANTVSTLGSFRQNLMASTSQTAVARAGVVGLAGAIGTLQNALVLSAGAFRALLAAFGGPIGIAITAISFGVGAWISKVDQASAAIDEHKRLVDVVGAAYDSAGDKADGWAKKIVGATEAQVRENLRQLREEFDKTAASAQQSSRVLNYAFQDFPKDSTQVKQLEELQTALEKVRNGGGIKDLEDSLNAIALNPADDQLKNVALEILNIVNSAGEGETSLKDLADAIEKSESNLRRMNGTMTDADKKLLGVKDAAKDTAQGLDHNGQVTKFNEVLRDMGKQVPGLADELKKLGEIDALKKQYDQAVKLATTMGQVFEATKRYQEAVAGVNETFDRKKFDSLPDSSKSLVDRIIYVEGGQTKATDTNKAGSNAQGIGQFIPSTFIPLFDRLFPALKDISEAQKLEYRYNEAYARPILEEFTKQNQVLLANAGVAPTDANTYLAHFLGAGDAIKVLLANPDELAKNIVNERSTAANPTVIKADTTARDLQNWAFSKVGGGSPIMAGGQTKQENFDEDLAQRVKGWKDEANARKESNREGTIAKAIAEAEAQAIRDNVTLSEKQRDVIREAAGAKYDSAHADEQLKANQEEARNQLNDIIGLDQQRKNLLQEIQMAQNAGDGGKTAELQTQLQGVNQQLADAVPKALELARALGDEKMVAQLQKVQLNTAKVGTQFTAFGLSASNVQQLVGNFADGIVQTFDAFAQAVANGENAIKALGQAFLQFAATFLREIATMILKQIILNALAGLGGPVGSAAKALGGAVPTAHTGGLVGASAAGGGNAMRQVSPMWFQQAVRYHSGGIAGLRPDEVPTILKKNEEVLTEQDPRHRFNTEEKSGSSKQAQPIKQVLVLDPKDLANALSSSRGEQVVLTHLKNNAATVRKMLG